MTWTPHESWIPIDDDAPRDGMVVELLIPYSRTKFTEIQCTDIGYFDRNVELPATISKGCWRFNGDDGAFDIQPSHWRPLRQYPMLHSLRKF